MVALPEIIDPTLAAIDRELERRAGLEPPRRYLGASLIGHACERFIWYAIRPDAPRQPRPARLIRAADDGYRTEAAMIERLRMVEGIELWTVDDSTGRQIGFSDLGGRFRGHVDGVIRGILQAPAKPHVWECKASSKFNDFRKAKATYGDKGALRAWNHQYYVQAVVYMHYLDLERHYTTVCTPGGRDYDSCRTNADPAFANALRGKAERILNAEEPPVRLSEKPEHWMCRMCDYRETCHG